MARLDFISLRTYIDLVLKALCIHARHKHTIVFVIVATYSIQMMYK